MKMREQIYRQEAASILHDLSMYRVLTEEQLLRLYPKKRETIKNLLTYMVRQGRIFHCGGYYCAEQQRGSDQQPPEMDRALLASVWVLLDFIDQVDYHSVGDHPAKIIFIAGEDIYEIVHVPEGKETLMNQILSTQADASTKYIMLVDQAFQIPDIHVPNACGYCTVAPDGQVQYFQKE